MSQFLLSAVLTNVQRAPNRIGKSQTLSTLWVLCWGPLRGPCTCVCSFCLRSAFKEYIKKKAGTRSWNSYSQALFRQSSTFGAKSKLFFSVHLWSFVTVNKSSTWCTGRLGGFSQDKKLKNSFSLTCRRYIYFFGHKCVLRKDICWSKCSR